MKLDEVLVDPPKETSALSPKKEKAPILSDALLNNYANLHAQYHPKPASTSSTTIIEVTVCFIKFSGYWH
jgi:hypothetical protein